MINCSMTNCFESLAALGWNDFFNSCHQQWVKDWTASGLIPARIISESRDAFTLAVAHNTFLGVISGRLRHSAGERLSLPAIGDWVLCSFADNADRAIIHSIFPRQTCLTRKQAGRGMEDQLLATNVNRALIVTSANAEYNSARLQRYLTAVREGGVEVEIVLSKIDLCPEASSLIQQIQVSVPDVMVTGVSVVSGAGLDELEKRLVPEQTFIFLGSSGVGKSTLLNHWMGQKVMRTNSISTFEDKGRHTTSARHLFALPSGALVIDTPGLREFRLGQFDQGLHETYEDILALSATCKFSNCRHQNEPHCAVQEAIKNGSLSETRRSLYIQLQTEVDAQKRKKYATPARNKQTKGLKR